MRSELECSAGLQIGRRYNLSLIDPRMGHLDMSHALDTASIDIRDAAYKAFGRRYSNAVAKAPPKVATCYTGKLLVGWGWFQRWWDSDGL